MTINIQVQQIITQNWNDACDGDVPARYTIGEIINQHLGKGRSSARTGAIEKLADLYRTSAWDLNSMCKVAACWTKPAFQAILAKYAATGVLLSWAHYRTAAYASDSVARELLLDQAVADGWSATRLRKAYAEYKDSLNPKAAYEVVFENVVTQTAKIEKLSAELEASVATLVGMSPLPQHKAGAAAAIIPRVEQVRVVLDRTKVLLGVVHP
jgi:hypothetical protein